MRCGAWARRGPADPRPETADPYAAALERLLDLLVTHLDKEESDLLPIIAEHITLDEWLLLPQHVMTNTPPQEQLYVIGSILEDATEDERTALLQGIPPQAKEAWEQHGRSAYVQRVRAARGSAPTRL